MTMEKTALIVDITFSNVSISSILFGVGLLIFAIALVLIFLDIKKIPIAVATLSLFFIVLAGLLLLFGIDMESTHEEESLNKEWLVEERKQNRN